MDYHYIIKGSYENSIEFLSKSGFMGKTPCNKRKFLGFRREIFFLKKWKKGLRQKKWIYNKENGFTTKEEIFTTIKMILRPKKWFFTLKKGFTTKKMGFYGKKNVAFWNNFVFMYFHRVSIYIIQTPLIN